MKKLSNHLLGVDQGSVVLFSDFENDGPMWTGKGPRAERFAVDFSERYRQPPSVFVSLSMWDTDAATNPRMDLSATDITDRGFVLVFKTWGDTRVARVRADWMSMGELFHDDDWDREG